MSKPVLWAGRGIVVGLVICDWERFHKAVVAHKKTGQKGRAIEMRDSGKSTLVVKSVFTTARHGGRRSDEAVSSDDLNHIVAQLGRLTRTASLEFSLRVGALIIHHFYGGNIDAWRRRGPKTTSFRRLAEHPGLPMSAGTLYRCVAIFELCERLDAPSRWQNLGASHLRLVLQVDAAAQESLLAIANSERWSVRELQQRVVESRSSRTSRGGRRPQSHTAKLIGTLKRCLVEHREALAGDVPPDPSELHDLELLLADTRVVLEQVRAALLHAPEFKPPADDEEEDSSGPESELRKH